MKIFNNPELEGSVGKIVTGIDCTDCDDISQIKKLSDLGEFWEIKSKCPKCNNSIYFNEHNINNLMVCKCGQKILLVIPKELI